MIEKIVLDYLTTALEGIGVYMQEPESNPVPGSATFVVIEKTGSSYENHLYSATIAVQSFAPTLYGAAALNELVKEAMFDIVTLDEVTRVDLNSDYNFTDETTKQPRYQAVFELVHY